jgi:hypothetical protein
MTGIAAQDITCKDEEGCAELGGCESRTISRQVAGLALRSGLVQPPPVTTALLCVWVYLKDAEGIAFGIYKVSLPAGIRYGEFRQRYGTSQLRDRFRSAVKILHFDRTDKRVGASSPGRSGGRTLQQPSPGSSGFDCPVGDGQAFHLVEFPVKDLGIEMKRASGIVCLDLEVEVTSIHG